MAKPITTADVATLEWWTVRECAARWKVSEDVVYAELNDGNLVGRKFRGSWRVHSSAIAEYEKPGIPKARRESAKFRTVPDALGRKAKSAV